MTHSACPRSSDAAKLVQQSMQHSSFVQVLQRLIAVEDKVAAAMLPGTMAAVVQALQKHKHACSLSVISSAVEAFHRDSTQQQVIQDAFRQACVAVAPLLQVRDHPQHCVNGYAHQEGQLALCHAALPS